MKSVLTAASMRQADEETIERFGLPGFTLMENAGRAAAQILFSRIESGADRVLCCCGTGNNGGDGLVVARFLAARNIDVEVLLVGAEEKETADARLNRIILENLQAGTGQTTALSIARADDSTVVEQSSATWIVDALLGTGFSGALREPVASFVDAINAHPARVMSLDGPTGLDSDNGTYSGAVVEADLTVSMAAAKPGTLINDGPTVCGEHHVVEIGIPDFILQKKASTPGSGILPEPRDVRQLLPERKQNSHKYTSGTLCVVAGSPGLTGAPVLASTAGLRVGAGAVYLACRESVRDAIEKKVVEVMTVGLSDDSSGLQADQALRSLSPLLAKSNAIVIGCGIGREANTVSFVRELLASWDGPAVVDADALFALSADASFITEHSNGNWILTPHQREFERLCGSKQNWSKRAELASRFADQWNCVLLLKGNPSVIGLPGQATVFNPTGNVALATAGTGDVLAGMIGGYLAQGLSSEDAAVVGTFVGGMVADCFVEEHKSSTMIASDVVDGIPRIVAQLLPDVQRRPTSLFRAEP